MNIFLALSLIGVATLPLTLLRVHYAVMCTGVEGYILWGSMMIERCVFYTLWCLHLVAVNESVYKEDLELVKGAVSVDELVAVQALLEREETDAWSSHPPGWTDKHEHMECIN